MSQVTNQSPETASLPSYESLRPGTELIFESGETRVELYVEGLSRVNDSVISQGVRPVVRSTYRHNDWSVEQWGILHGEMLGDNGVMPSLPRYGLEVPELVIEPQDFRLSGFLQTLSPNGNHYLRFNRALGPNGKLVDHALAEDADLVAPVRRVERSHHPSPHESGISFATQKGIIGTIEHVQGARIISLMDSNTESKIVDQAKIGSLGSAKRLLQLGKRPTLKNSDGKDFIDRGDKTILIFHNIAIPHTI